MLQLFFILNSALCGSFRPLDDSDTIFFRKGETSALCIDRYISKLMKLATQPKFRIDRKSLLNILTTPTCCGFALISKRARSRCVSSPLEGRGDRVIFLVFLLKRNLPSSDSVLPSVLSVIWKKAANRAGTTHVLRILGR